MVAVPVTTLVSCGLDVTTPSKETLFYHLGLEYSETMYDPMKCFVTK